MTASHIYPGAYSLNAYVTIRNCHEAIEFYKKAFGAKEKERLLTPDGHIAHASIEIEGSLLMMSDEDAMMGSKSPESLGGNPVTLSLYVKDVDKVFKTAIDAGGSVIMPVEDQFYGDRSGTLVDPFGYRWMIGTHKKEVSMEEMQKLSNKMFEAQHAAHHN
ncbi:MAG: VOC family protein [Bacteroidota bacterium]|nr:VOC family protein [Bacteroidota bacterium]